MTPRLSSALRVWLCLVVLLFPSRLSADQASDDFARGDFLAAAVAARGLDTSQGDALAARATLIYIEFLALVADRAALLKDALSDARRAVSRDDGDTEGHLYLAIALGFKARMEGNMAAHFEGLGHEAYNHIEKALKLAPDDGWAHAVLGGWNLEICIRGGLLGRSIYRASVSKGMASFEKALALDPDNPSIIFQYAVQLIALQEKDSKERALALLAPLHVVSPLTALQRLGLQRALVLEALLKKGDAQRIDHYIGRQMALKNDPISLSQP